jgi:hypothetical protein
VELSNDVYKKERSLNKHKQKEIFFLGVANIDVLLVIDGQKLVLSLFLLLLFQLSLVVALFKSFSEVISYILSF